MEEIKQLEENSLVQSLDVSQEVLYAQQMHKVDLIKLEELKQKLHSLDIFSNMVVHDMRGPVTSMKIAM